MRHLAFTDHHVRAQLEAILHPLIQASALAECQQVSAPYVILAVPLLVETGNWQSLCDRVLVVDCSTASQIARVIQRSGLSQEEVHKILAAQASREQRLSIADDVIGNDAAPEDLMPHVLRLHQQYLTLAAAKTSCQLLRFARKWLRINAFLSLKHRRLCDHLRVPV